MVGGWWLVVGVGGGGGGGGDELGPCIRYLRRPQISATPNDTYESKMASPIIRTQMAYQRPRFFNPSGPWVGPRGPEGPKNFLGGWLAEPMSFEKKPSSDFRKIPFRRVREFEAKNQNLCAKGCLCIP